MCSRPAVFAILLSLFSASQAAVAADTNNTVYEIFVRSFYDSDGNGVGDLKGVAAKLDDYLNDGKPETDTDLEVGILWLMPIFPTNSYHGYDVKNFRDINPEYGTIDDFKALIAAAHSRGVRIILDIPFNHTSPDHPWFQEAVSTPTSSRRQFYHFHAEDSEHQNDPWHRPANSTEIVRYLGLFSPQMPDLNFDNPVVLDEVRAIAKFWLDLGVDGFRLDAAKHIFADTFGRPSEQEILKNNDWWRKFSQFVYQTKPDAILVGEVLGDPEMLRRHAWGNDGLLDEPYMNDIRNQVAWPRENFVSQWKAWTDSCRQLNRTAYDSSIGFPDQPFEPFIFVASHDRNPRFASDLEAMKSNGMQASVEEAYRLGMYSLLSMAKYPVIYNGDEVMQRGWKWNGNPPNSGDKPGDGSNVFDETLREPFPWNKNGAGAGQTTWFQPKFDHKDDGVSKEEQDHPEGLFHLVRGLTNFRAEHRDFADQFVRTVATDDRNWMAFERAGDNASYMVIINLTNHGDSYHFHEQWYPEYVGSQLMLWADGKARKWMDETPNDKHIGREAFVAPYGLVVLKAN